MRKLAYLIGVAAVLGSAGYLMTYVARWQWNRALFSGIALIIALLLLGLAGLARRISALEDAVRSSAEGRDDELLADLRATRPRRQHFAWLEESLTRPNVFITLMLGGGAIVSGIAWIVGRVAEQTTTPQAEGRLARRMAPLAFPEAGLRPADDPAHGPAAALLRGPGGGTGHAPAQVTPR